MADYKSSEGKVIGGRRFCGKTTELIKRASEEQLYILCSNKTMARMIFKQAQDMGLNIPFPVTVDDLPLKGYMKEVLVDEAEMVLSQLVGKRVVGMSTSMEMKELEPINKKEIEYEGGIDFAKGNDLTVKITADVSDALKGLKAVQKETRKTISFLKELEEYEKGYKDSLLVIELEDENSVPRIYHNGERITQLTDVHFEWLTKTGKPGKTSFNIGYCEKEATGFPLKKGIALDKVNV